jgi:hypothetical protein
MASNPLVGTWALVSTEWRRADGRHANPFGEGAVGILTYDDAGFMSAQIMRASRPALAPDSPAGIETAMSSAVAGYVAYFGRYTIEPGAKRVDHEVIGSAFPAWVGTTHQRHFETDGETLTLRQDFTTVDGVAVAAATTWRRVA